jgi:hypothetical protein
MQVFLDDRCITGNNLYEVLSHWKQLIESAAQYAPEPVFLFDSDITEAASVKRDFNAMRKDHKFLFRSMLFGGHGLKSWRSCRHSDETICKMECENDDIVDGTVCELYEHLREESLVALFGFGNSSFSDRQSVRIERLLPPAGPLPVKCRVAVGDFHSLILSIGGRFKTYQSRIDPPSDGETVLRQQPDRFERTGRFERRGRSVYREVATRRYFYVDSLHVGPRAHLEVFCARGNHVGTANLQGVVDESTRVHGRRISW